tara:strand:+ start:6394 stop:7041 length:648 start_codon:yes stop_codon:yes gene_type:complete
VIYGNGSVAELLLHYITKDSQDQVVAFTVDKEFAHGSEFLGLPLCPFEQLENNYPTEKYHLLVAIGYSNMRNRMTMFEKAKSKNYRLASYISTQASVDESATLGENSIVFPMVIIEPFSRIGDNNIFWSGCLICHHSEIDSHCFFASRSLVGGESKILQNCFLGFQSVVLQQLNIGAETLVAAGSLVTKHTQGSCQYRGTPAKKVSEHKTNGICL